MYLALAAEAAGGAGGEGEKRTSLLRLPRRISGQKRARIGDAGAAVGTSSEDDADSDGGETSDGSRHSKGSRQTPVKARSLLHATISRYFDEGSHGNNSNARGDSCPPGADGDSTGGTSPSGDHVASSGDTPVDADSVSMVVDGVEAATAREPTAASASGIALRDEEGKAEKRAEALPHQTLDKRACEVLVRDASVLVTDPSFQGRLNAGFDDGYGGGGCGGGLGFFDVAARATAAAGGRGGAGATGVAPHSWLLKVNEDLLLWCCSAVVLRRRGLSLCGALVRFDGGAHVRGMCLRDDMRAMSRPEIGVCGS